MIFVSRGGLWTRPRVEGRPRNEGNVALDPDMVKKLALLYVRRSDSPKSWYGNGKLIKNPWQQLALYGSYLVRKPLICYPTS